MSKAKACSLSTATLKSNAFLMFDSKTDDLVPIEEALELLNTSMETNAYVQQCYVDAFLNNERIIREVGTHTTAAQRQQFTEITKLPESWKSTNIYTRSNIDEACRILKIWQECKYIAELVVGNKDATNEEIVRKLGYYTSYNLISNIRRSQQIPQNPEIDSARLLLGIDPNLIKTLRPEGVWLHNMHIVDKTVDIFIPIAKRQYENFGKIVKIGAPIIRRDGYNHYEFDFMIKSRRKTPTLQPNYLGVDPKLNGGFAAALINGENRQISGYIMPSVQVQRCQRKIDHISNDIGLKRRKVRNIAGCENPDYTKIDLLYQQISDNREKRNRIKEALDWQAACDLAEAAQQFCANICYENVKCNMGGRLHFRSTLKRDKVKQVATKRGCTVIDVNAAYTSQDCPKCGNRAKKKLSERTHKCSKCGLKCDRDYASAVNMAERGMKIKNDDVRWTEAIEAKKQIVRHHKTLGNQTGETVKTAQNSGGRGLGKISQTKRVALYWGYSAKRSTRFSFSGLYLVGTIDCKVVSTKQKTSDSLNAKRTKNTASTNSGGSTHS